MKRLLIVLAVLLVLVPVSAQDHPCEDGFRLIEHALAASVEQFGSPRLANIALEQIPVIDADYVFAFTTNGLTPGDAQDDLAELQDNPLWQALDVVQEDRLYIVENYWFGTGYIAAHAIIDDLYAVVAGVEPEIANPFRSR